MFVEMTITMEHIARTCWSAAGDCRREGEEGRRERERDGIPSQLLGCSFSVCGQCLAELG